MTAFFVTATGTGVGKTFVTAAILHQARQAGLGARALKPVISGWETDAVAESDTGILIAAMGLEVTQSRIDAVTPVRLKAPLSPHMAARLEEAEIDISALTAFCRRGIDAASDFLLIEGAGGAFVPITDTYLTIDLIRDLDLPALVVAGSYLGTLSHILATVEAMHARGVATAGIVISETEGSDVSLTETCATIRRLLPTIPVVALPRIDGPDGWRRAPHLLDLLRPA